MGFPNFRNPCEQEAAHECLQNVKKCSSKNNVNKGKIQKI